MIAVTSGSLVPGLCFDVGAASFGCQLGMAERQSLIAAPVESGAFIEWPRVHGISLASHPGSKWALGMASMRTLARQRSHAAIISGRALCGVAAQGGRESFLHVGFHAVQGVSVSEDGMLEVAGTNASAWPHLFDLQILASTNINETRKEQ